MTHRDQMDARANTIITVRRRIRITLATQRWDTNQTADPDQMSHILLVNFLRKRRVSWYAASCTSTFTLPSGQLLLVRRIICYSPSKQKPSEECSGPDGTAGLMPPVAVAPGRTQPVLRSRRSTETTVAG